MNIFVLSYHLAYLGINLLIGGLISNLLSPEIQFPDSTFTLAAVIVFITLTLAELCLPKKLKTLQMLLSALIVVLQLKNASNLELVSSAILIAIAVIKFYALYCAFKRVKDILTGKRQAAVNPSSGKDFYQSQAWRKLRYAALNTQGRRCVSCGEQRVKNYKGDLIRYHVDHIKPRSKYPHLALDPNNLQVLCEACNLGKSNHWDIDHRRERDIA